jgi:hypothetical protein
LNSNGNDKQHSRNPAEAQHRIFTIILDLADTVARDAEAGGPSDRLGCIVAYTIITLASRKKGRTSNSFQFKQQ